MSAAVVVAAVVVVAAAGVAAVVAGAAVAFLQRQQQRQRPFWPMLVHDFYSFFPFAPLREASFQKRLFGATTTASSANPK